MTQTGGCLCGQVRYEIAGDALATAICHCKNCQRQSGAAFSINLIVMQDQLSTSGALNCFDDSGDSGNTVKRYFCEVCGSPIYSGLAGPNPIAAVKVGTLDDASTVTPGAQVWCDSKQNWLHLPLDVPTFPKNPPMG